jgi:hypothetical protein
VAQVVQRFLDCGLLENGFVRIRCPSCRASLLVAFSCKCRYLCPSCHAKRLLVWSEWIESEILQDVPHRQYVFTAARVPVALSRITYDPEGDAVSFASDRTDGPTAGTHRFHALELLARLLSHVPRRNEIYVRYYGAYSVRRRAAWRKRGVRPGDDEGTTPQRLPESEAIPESVRARSRRWAELLRKIWDVDVRACPRCGERMAILAFTLNPSDIRATRETLSAAGADPRAGPWSERAPPLAPV